VVAIVGVRDTSIPYYYHAAATGTTLLCSFFTTAAISVKVGRHREQQQCEMKKDDEVEYELFVFVVSIVFMSSQVWATLTDLVIRHSFNITGADILMV